MALSTARIITPTSAKMAAHMFVIPAAVRARQANFTMRENTMFCRTMPVHPGGEPIADQLARQLSLPEVRLQPELLAEAERRLERERAARRETLRALLETAERTEGSFAVCGYDPMQLRAQDGLLRRIAVDKAA